MFNWTRWIMLTVSLLAHLVCVGLTVQFGKDGIEAGIVFSWLVVPATVSAIACAPRWSPLPVAAANGLGIALVTNYLMLSSSYFWPDQPQTTQLKLAVGYLFLFPLVAGTCGGFVGAVLHAIESDRSRRPLLVGTLKGMSFAVWCVVLSVTGLFLLLLAMPLGTMDDFLLIFSIGFPVFGTVAGAITGGTYDSLRNTQST